MTSLKMYVNRSTGPRARAWCFTINNYTDEDVQRVRDIINKDNCVCGIAEYEHQQEGTPHIQGFIRFQNQISFKSLQNQFNKRAHIEVTKGKDEANWAYCSKEGNVFIQKGEPQTIERLSRTKVISEIEAIRGCKERSELERLVPNWAASKSKWSRCLEIWTEQRLLEMPKAWDGDLSKKNFWLVGPSGSGKSRFVHNFVEPTKLYMKQHNKWWDGFLQGIHCTVLLDEVTPSEMNQGERAGWLLPLLKMWSDRYPMTAEVKGAQLYINPGTFYLFICSNYSIEQCLEGLPDELGPLKRRFTQIEIPNPLGAVPPPFDENLLHKF